MAFVTVNLLLSGFLIGKKKLPIFSYLEEIYL